MLPGAGAMKGRNKAEQVLTAQKTADEAECVQVENELVGWQLYDAPGARAVLPMLRSAASTFHAPHDRIVAEIAKAVDQGDCPTPATIALRMRADSGLAEIGGKEYLLGLARAAPAIPDEAYGRARMESALRLYRQLTTKLQIADASAAVVEAIASGSDQTSHLVGELHRLHIAARGQAVPRITLVPFDAIALSGARRDLVKGIIPRIGLTVVWGPPKCGKSFWVFDLSMHVARAVDYRGRRVQGGAVVYCAFEGQSGMEARKAAYAKRFMEAGESGVPFYLQSLRLDLVADHPELIAAVRAQVEGASPAMIVLDTLNRSIRGSESDDRDMSAYVCAADALREAFQCAIVIVHHCGWEGTRPRGHSSLPGAVEAQIGVKRDSADCIIAEVELAKDGPQGEQIVSRLEVVEVGLDEDGEPITSCVIVPDETAVPTAQSAKIKGAAGVALDLLRKAIDEAGEPAPPTPHIPRDARTCRTSTWRTYCYQGTVTDSTNSDSKRKAFVRASTELQSRHIIGIWGDFAWIK